jgi:hypothetical protein
MLDVPYSQIPPGGRRVLFLSFQPPGEPAVRAHDG